MNKVDNAQRIKDIMDVYKKEYERVNGKSVAIAYAMGWFTLHNSQHSKYRFAEISAALERLKKRPNHSS